jgi:hypothetical protein
MKVGVWGEKIVASEGVMGITFDEGWLDEGVLYVGYGLGSDETWV